ncbi:condensation domain-containing protein, partial [Nocardia sp. NPDC051911]|uniref:condensation domain-containing protein n=2 Tax=Nocardia TaxID=1817 RepID=UPI00342B90FE
RAHNCTLFMVVHAALAVLLARLTGDPDVAIGTPIAGRGQRALDELVGMFVNTLTLRTRVETGMSFTELIDQARETDLAAFANADIPFERVVEIVAPGRATTHNPLFGVVLSFQNNEQPTLQLPGLTVTALDTDTVAAKFDLQVNINPHHHDDGTPAELDTIFTYATDLFDETTIHTLGHRLERILTTIATNPHTPIGDIDILDRTEREMGTARSVPTPPPNSAATAGTTLAQTLVAAVEDDPDAPAILSGDDELSYHDLETRSSRLARVLIARGCGPGAGVALRLDRGMEAVIATWAVLKTGAAVVPDTALPDDLEAKVGLTLGDPPTGTLDWLALDDPAVIAEIAAESPRPVTYAHRTRALTGTDPAFVGDQTLSYDDLAIAAAQLRDRDELTYESEIPYRGEPRSSAVVIELVAAGMVGAAVVLDTDEEVQADECVTG